MIFTFIIDRVNTFELDKPVTQLTELNDGNVLSDILFEMYEIWFITPSSMWKQKQIHNLLSSFISGALHILKRIH